MPTIKSFSLLTLVWLAVNIHCQNINLAGPGLQPETIVLPARYFVVNFTSVDTKSYTPDLASNLAVEITGKSAKNNHCRVWVNKLDRKDGSFIVRYKIYETCYDLSIKIFYKNKQIADSPINFKGPIYPDQCDCPVRDFQEWLNKYGCSNDYQQIEKDLQIFKEVNMKQLIPKIIENYHKPESTSFCHYVIKDNKLYRNCYGKHVGFNMFADNILLSLTRKAVFPDLELVINLGDWPLVTKGSEPLPIFSWCGSDETLDIVMPTYDLTESTLENMGRLLADPTDFVLSNEARVTKVYSLPRTLATLLGPTKKPRLGCLPEGFKLRGELTKHDIKQSIKNKSKKAAEFVVYQLTKENSVEVTLDILSVQGGAERAWPQREPRAVWRGRDSRAERLKLVDIARAHPELFNVSLTNFFFFRDKEAQYGPKQPHISFFKFFDFKYQVNIDGTVAAYRMPYLLAGGGMVLKQDSPYYEHFYGQLRPWEHYVPVKRDLSDLTDRIRWALEHDDEAYKITTNAIKFSNENLLPQHIICYHAVLFSKWSKKITSEVTVVEGMTHVPQPTFTCECEKDTSHDEL